MKKAIVAYFKELHWHQKEWLRNNTKKFYLGQSYRVYPEPTFLLECIHVQSYERCVFIFSKKM